MSCASGYNRDMKIRTSFIFVVVALLVMAIGGSAAGSTNVGSVVVIRQGRIGENHWTVEAAPEGKGICLEVGVTTNGGSESGRGQCSFPSSRRGILLVSANPLRHHVPPAMMVVGGAFNSAVRKVVVRYFDGSTKRVHLFPIDREETTGPVARFKYVAFAVRGPWCARSVTTYGRNGNKLWRGGWEVFDSAWHYKPFYNPGVLCRE
jgi:hypothetical protein